MSIDVILPTPHKRQIEFLDSTAKRRVIRAGRRGGKTVGMSIAAVEAFLEGRRVLYGAPTTDQVDTFWRNVRLALQGAIDAGKFRKDESNHVIELYGTEQRIRAKTAWNADTLRGDYADFLILDEFQLMHEDAWQVVGAPMLLDNNGDAVFIYTPPSIRSAGVSKAQDKRHASKLYKRAQADTTGRWATFHFQSDENPHLSREALDEIALDMTAMAYRQEILAEDIDQIPGALWTWEMLDITRVGQDNLPDMVRIVVGVDPKASVDADSKTGIVVVGKGANGHLYVLEDGSINESPDGWGRRVDYLYNKWSADRIVPEVNQGGDMVTSVLRTVNPMLPIQPVRATKGKYVRAEPIAALYEQRKMHHAGIFAELEEQMCTYVPGADSPDNMDALVWAASSLMERGEQRIVENPFYG